MAAVCNDAGCVLDTSCAVRRSARVMHKFATNSEPELNKKLCSWEKGMATGRPVPPSEKLFPYLD